MHLERRCHIVFSCLSRKHSFVHSLACYISVSVFPEVKNKKIITLIKKHGYKSIKTEHIKCKYVCYWVYLFYNNFSIGCFGCFFSFLCFPLFRNSSLSVQSPCILFCYKKQSDGYCFVPRPRGSKFSSMKLFRLGNLNCFFRPRLRPS